MSNTPGRNFGGMDFDLYKKIIDDICEFEHPIKVLRLYKDGEPLLNKNFAAMVAYAKDRKCAERVDTTTNASALTPDRSLEIINAGLDRINISIYGVTTDQYKNFSNNKVDYQKLVNNVRFFYENKKQCEMLVKINGDLISKSDAQKFLDDFGDITDRIYIESVMSCWPEFEFQEGVETNQDVGIYKQDIKEVLACPYIFYSFSINSDGSASTCFLDWSRDLIIGDTKTQKVKDIWLGEPMKKHQIMMLNGERKNHPICKNCGQLTHGMPDNIDEHRMAILEKL
jgi:MoaA/NifB/PqqE/SkfB family radical SAM enzyme